ncbi:type VI secretion system-associated FHA domain protein TagH [Paraburkholderia sp.]|uniref:type VI secretion system-associated FHA domain protein TagH n=1 Tax=Paraburkholderia sp. TaxID=1926495 RepID=UPI0025F31F44|nr:type VI secretion system-associated FHA domain protein TagH [Paraburkholderia sp.]
MQLTNPVLTLRVSKYNDEPLAEPITVRFGPDGGTIGRAATCTLVLPDQQRAISRVHARVECRGGDYLLCDIGANPSVLNQRALGGTREARLASGDQLMIGAYLIEVSMVEGGAQDEAHPFGHDPLASAKVLSGAPQSAADAGASADPFGMGGLDALGAASFGAGERIVTRPGFAGSESDHVSPELQAFAPPTLAPLPTAAQTGGGIPADYDPLADALAQWESSGGAGQAGAPSLSPLSPLSSPAMPGVVHAQHAVAPVVPAGLPTGLHAAGVSALAPGGPTGLPPSLAGETTPGSATPFDDLFAPAVPAVPVRSDAGTGGSVPLEHDPLGLASFAAPVAREAQHEAQHEAQREAQAAPSAPPQPLPAQSIPVTQMFANVAAQPAPDVPAQSQTQPQPQTRPQKQTRPPAQTQPRATAHAVDEATLAALYEGLGLDPARAPNLPPADFARAVGMMLRESLRGTMSVLRARSMTKREARLGTTVIVERDNNPLKFFPDVDSALAQMLTGRASGYLPPDEAVARAFADIESHELAVLVGMRAALAHVLSRFDPAALEAQLAQQGVLDRVLSNPKAKLWDRFVELRESIAREAQDDFQKLFGEAFNDAYEAQIDAMHRARDAALKKKDPT